MKTYGPRKSTVEVRGGDRSTLTRNVLIISGVVTVIILALLWWWFAAQGGGNPLHS